MNRICLFPGTFDPITLGHIDIIQRALPLFDKIIIGVGKNKSKTPLFDEQRRVAWIKEIFKTEAKINVLAYEGLTVDCCKINGAQFILRGLRKSGDFDFEKSIADVNRKIAGIETVFISSLPELSYIESSLVREVIKNKGDISQMVATAVSTTI